MVDGLNICLDLFAGLGGASSAFIDDPDWVVIRIDNNPELLEHTEGLIISDIANIKRTLPIIHAVIESVKESYHIGKFVIWASPPCVQYSFANMNRDPDNFDNTLLIRTLEYIDRLNPDAWIIENVKGAIETFNDIVGMNWVQSVGPVFMWGQFPVLAFEDAAHRKHKKMLNSGTRALRPNIRALVPFEVSDAYKKAVLYQTRLTNWGN
jgi:site-specific DNA-cytosine methylase